MHRWKDNALAQALNDTQRANQLPAAPPGKDGRKHIEHGADGETHQQRDLAAEFTSQLTGGHLGHHIAPKEAAQDQGFNLLWPCILLQGSETKRYKSYDSYTYLCIWSTYRKIGISGSGICHGHQGYRQIDALGIGHRQCEEEQESLPVPDTQTIC